MFHHFIIRVQHIVASLTPSKSDELEENEDPLLHLAELMPRLIAEVRCKIEVSAFAEETVNSKSIAEELENYFKTGNCGPVTSEMVCINPTLLEVDSNRWIAHGLSCPFESFLPFPFEQLMMATNSSCTDNKDTLFHHCQSVLKEQMVQYLRKKNALSFSFYLGDCLNHCMLNQDWKNRFAVVHTSNLADIVGLANLLPAVSVCLVDDPNALILTESNNWHKLKPTVAEYVESSLCCSLSLMPTIYGLRLVNPVRLGSSIPVKIWQNTPNLACLKWQRTPNYSRNMKLEMAATVVDSLKDLQKLCFSISKDENCGLINATPLTYHYIIHSLMNRCTFLDSGHQFLLHPPSVPAMLQLSWKTQQLWTSGEEVVQYEMTISFKKNSNQLPDRPIKLLLVPDDQLSQYSDLIQPFMADNGSLLPNPESQIVGAHYLENSRLNCSAADSFEETLSVSFLLPQNPEIADSHGVYILDASFSLPIYTLGPLSQFKKSVVKNRFPSPLIPHSNNPPTDEDPLDIICYEFLEWFCIDVCDKRTESEKTG